MLQLPDEILLNVLQHLDPLALECLRSCCRSLALLINESVWRDAFYCRYRLALSQQIPRVETTWRRESLLRARVIKDIHRGRGKLITVEPKIGESTTVHYDSVRHLLCTASVDTGKAVVVDCASGQIAARDRLSLDAAINLDELRIVRALEFGFAYGFVDGKVALSTVDKASGHWYFRYLQGRHQLGIVSIEFADNRFFTVDLVGVIKTWDPQTGICTATHTTGLGQVDLLLTNGRRILVSSEADFLVLDAHTMLHQHRRHAPISLHWSPATVGSVDVIWSTQQIIRPLSTGVLCISFDGTVQRMQRSTRKPVENMAISPLATTRWAAVLYNDGVIDIYDASNLLAAPHVTCYVKVDQPITVSRLAVSQTIVAVGLRDGSVQVFDILSGEPQRPLVKRYKRRMNAQDNDGNRAAVLNIRLHPVLPKGVIGYLTELIAFDLDPSQGDKSNGKRKGLRHKASLASPVGRAAMTATIQQEVQDLTNAEQREILQHQHLLRYAGDLSEELTEEELIAYMRMVSVQDGDLDAAVRASLAEAEAVNAVEQAARPPPQQRVGRWSQEEMDLALALSLDSA